MKFGRVPVTEAEGAVLAHGVAGAGVTFKKGRTLSATDIDALTRAEVTEVMVARLEPGDVPEDEAARRIGGAALGPHTTLSAAMTGRTNLYAAERGLTLIDASRVDAINAIHESITIATLAPYELVERHQMLATVKIIPFAAPAPAVKQAEELAKALTAASPKAARQALVSIAPFTPKKIALISTSLPGMKASLLDKNRAVLAARVEALGSAISLEIRCTHDTEPVRGAISDALATKPDIVMIFGASATTDRADAVPAGITAVGGTIDHFGMPVDPGNLLLLAHLGAMPVIGLPGCARSPKVNGFDFVLQRLCAGVPVTPADLMRMGVGGLLKEIPTRPQPRDITTAKPRAAVKLAAIVLAAGKSTRMGERNKLLMPLHGEPMIARTATAVAASPAKPIIVVTGNDADAVKAALKNQPMTFAHNPRYADGMSTSLHAGLAALPADADAVLICLGDMPAITPAAIGKLIAAFNPTEGRAIIVPTFQGKRGNPVLFARAYVDEMMHLEGDTGARALLSDHAEAVYEVETDAGVLADADTPAAFAALEAEFKT
jgi:molybdenum cofactor cytidylyltransferase